MARMIDADELTKVIENMLYEPDSVQYIWSSDVLSAIRSAPTVQPVYVVHGEWEPCNDYNGYCRCSQCHDVYIDPAWLVDGKWAFCPKCGAKMDGEEE